MLIKKFVRINLISALIYLSLYKLIYDRDTINDKDWSESHDKIS